MRKLAVAISVALIFVGCAGKLKYQPPEPTTKTKHSITIKQSKDAVWKKIIPLLGSSFFVVNNLDKESGFINISYSGDPEKYVDCGFIDSYVSNLRGERHYVFPASTAYKEYETMTNGNLLYLRRRMNLEGRINIIVQEISAEQTLVAVNAKYVLTKDTYASNLQNQSQRINDNISFNTNGSAIFPGGTQCFSTGSMEAEVLEAIGM